MLIARRCMVLWVNGDGYGTSKINYETRRKNQVGTSLKIPVINVPQTGTDGSRSPSHRTSWSTWAPWCQDSTGTLQKARVNDDLVVFNL